MAAISEDMGKLSGNESVSLSPDLMAENAKGQNLQKAAKALLSELEELLSVLVEGQSGATPVASTKGVDVSVAKKSDVEQLVQTLKDIGTGKETPSKLLDVISKISALLGSGSEGVKDVISIATKSFEGTDAKKEMDKYLKIAEKYTGLLEAGFKSGEVTPEEVLGNDNVKVFLAGLAGDKGALTPKGKKSTGPVTAKTPGSTSKTPGSTAKTPGATAAKGKDTDDYKLAIFNLAMTVQQLLSDIMNGQSDQNKLMNECSKTQGTNARTLLATKITDMIKEIQAQADAGKKPWWMYLIAAVLAVAGAALAAFTGGIAAGVVALVIGAIMASPLGSMITDGLVTAMVGPNPSEADKMGATVAAVAIITVITTILSCGAAGFSGAAEGVGEGALDAAEVAGEAGSVALKNVVATVAEEATEGAVNDGAQAAIKKGVTYSMKAALKGIESRAGGNFIQGFVGGGGVTDAIEAIMLSYPKSKEWMKSQTGAIVMGIVAAVIAIIGSLAGGDMAGDGMQERSSFLKGAKGLKELTLGLSKGVQTGVEVVQKLALGAQAGTGIAKYFQLKEVARLQQVIGSVSAQSSLADTDVKSLQKMQKNISDTATSQEKTLQNSLSGLLNTMDVEGKNQEAALTS